MIVNRTMLLVSKVIGGDKKNGNGTLANVHITKNGAAAIACNGRSVMAVEGVSQTRQDSIPFQGSGEDFDTAVTIPLDLVDKILRSVPIDKQMDGQLELLHINEGKKNGGLLITTHDGKGAKELQGSAWGRKYVDYQGIMEMLYFSQEVKAHVILDRKRLMDLLQAMNKICGDTPTYLEITKKNDILLRSFSADTEQRVTAAMAGIMTDWEEPGDFTKSLRKQKRVVRRRKAEKVMEKKRRLKKK